MELSGRMEHGCDAAFPLMRKLPRKYLLPKIEKHFSLVNFCRENMLCCKCICYRNNQWQRKSDWFTTHSWSSSDSLNRGCLFALWFGSWDSYCVLCFCYCCLLHTISNLSLDNSWYQSLWGSYSSKEDRFSKHGSYNGGRYLPVIARNLSIKLLKKSGSVDTTAVVNDCTFVLWRTVKINQVHCGKKATYFTERRWNAFCKLSQPCLLLLSFS